MKRLALILCALALAATGCRDNAAPAEPLDGVVYELNVRQFTPEGTFKAAAAHLPHLKAAGVDILWVMPLYPIGEKGRKGTLGSYYAVRDYCATNPEFGSLEDFCSLVGNAHKLGMKVIIDWVANHTSPDHAWVTEKPLEWYVRDSEGNTVTEYDWTDIAKLNYDCQDLRAEMEACMKFWLDHGIDGFRCDMASLVPQDFWTGVILRFRKDYARPLYFLAEAEEAWLHEAGFDATYSWRLHHALNDIAQGTIGVDSLKRCIDADLAAFPQEARRLAFTSNHDENSWAGTEFERMGDAWKAMTVLCWTLPRTQPLIYTGQEIGWNHRFQFFEKDPMPSVEANAFTDFYRSLAGLRRSHPALTEGSFEVIESADPDIFAFRRVAGDDTVNVKVLCRAPWDWDVDVLATQETVLKDWSFNGRPVRVPHDWAIDGPFDRANDLQNVAVTQNGETVRTWHTGRSGGLPWMGKGIYTTKIEIPSSSRHYELLFDGAMSGAKVFVGGREAGQWPYGYNSFSIDITPFVHVGENDVRVELENLPQSSRWYPGAGLYRKVRLVSRPAVNIPLWGVYITAPEVSERSATVKIEVEATGAHTVIYDARGNAVAEGSDEIIVSNPRLWSPEKPYLYTAVTRIPSGDEAVTRFGIRSIELRPGEGFFLNGEHTMFKGVCLHHDLGPLGAAVNRSALRHQLEMLKDMGCNAIRTSHNMPAEELVDLCDEMGLMMMVESFDEWGEAKCANGYNRLFDEWAEKDLVNMVRHYRSHPCVVMWSIGNEVPNQWRQEGPDVARRLQDICHREDPTRPVTCGMDQFDGVLANGFAAALDVPSFNYKVNRYEEAYPQLPQGYILGSETASTVSSRGVYHFPVAEGANVTTDDHQSSSYDLEHCWWSNIPDDDFAVDEDFPWVLGQFVWTGFDYLGEPSPYDTDAWPNHSSVFGIIDLASIPKDRFYLYRSVWNTESPTLHVLPHWTWPGREGEITPVFVYTSYPSAELFVNGVSQGVRTFSDENHLTRHRLMWNDVVYAPGEIEVVAYDAKGREAARKSVRTSGEAAAITAKAPRRMPAGSDNLAYITVGVCDADGNPCSTDGRKVSVEVSGAGSFEAIANGDPCCLESFRKPEMHLFSGALTVIVRGSAVRGKIRVTLSAEGLEPKTIEIDSI